MAGELETPEVPQEPTVETKETKVPETPEEQTTETPEETQEEEKEKPFNPDEMDFEEPEKEVDLTHYESLREQGIDIDSPQFKANVSLLEECGMNSPEMIANFLLKVKEKHSELNKQPSAKEIQQSLRQNLTKEEQSNYKAIGNMFKTIFGNDEEAINLINRDIMSNPYLVKVVNMIRNYYVGNNGNPTPKNTAAVVKKDTANTDFETAVNEVNKKIALKLRENGGKISKSEKSAITKEIRNKVKASDIQRFDNYFN